MADRPILFSAPMIRALLAGSKTQTRRVMKPQPRGTPWFWDGDEVDPVPGWFDGYETGREPCGAATREVNDPIKLRIGVGDRLWVKETHAIVPRTAYRISEGVQQTLRTEDNHDAAVYAAEWDRSKPGRWRPSIHMPRWASRITLIVTDVRVERLQDISEADAIAEGIERHKSGWMPYSTAFFDGDGVTPANYHLDPRESYRQLWNLINGAGAWESNPWVVAYTFTVHHGNIDQLTEVAA
ncbi:hypothetical protein [Agrobacterium tumefaciens]|uniref:hypothetical protein n=1 Tax=Agrobacterium tumefaciens TaxID=358 RepID=UPI003BA2393C